MKNETIVNNKNLRPDSSDQSDYTKQPERTKNLLFMDGIVRNDRPVITESSFKQKVFTTRKDDFSGKKPVPKGSKFCWSKCYCCPFGIWSWR